MNKISNLLFVGIFACLVTACGAKQEEKDPSPNYEENAPNVIDQAEKFSDGKPAEEHDMENMKAKADDMADIKDMKPVASTKSGVAVINPKAGVNFPAQKTSDAFFVLKNDGKEDVEVKSISSNVAKVTEFHTMEMKDNKMVMRKMDKVVIPAGGMFAMKKGGDKHVMLIELKNSLSEGDDVTFDLELSNGEKLNFTVKAENMDESMQMPMDKDKGEMKHDMKDMDKGDMKDMKHDEMKKEETLSNISIRNVSQAKDKPSLSLVFGYMGIAFASVLLIGCGQDKAQEKPTFTQLNELLQENKNPCADKLITFGNELIGEKEHFLQLETIADVNDETQKQPTKEQATNTPLTLSGLLLYKDRPTQARFDATLLDNQQCLVSYQLNYQFKDPCMTIREEAFKKYNQIGQLNDSTRYYVHKRHPNRKAYLTNIDRNRQCLVSVKDSQIL